MKIGLLNIEKIKKMSRKFASMITLSAALVSPFALTGCSNKQAEQTDAIETLDENATVTEEATPSVTPEVTETATPTPTVQEQNYEYTEGAWNEFKEDAWNSIKGKINNVNQDEFDAALMIFNIDYLDQNNPNILINYYSKGIDAENELNRAYNVLSQIREYNTTVDKAEDIYSTTNLLISAKDKAIITTLESYLKEVKNSETSKERVEEIFNTISDFSLGKAKIAVPLAGEIIEVAQIEMTKGAVVLSENVMQSISVECQNIIAEDKRAILDDSLRTKDVLAAIQEIMVRNNAIASVTNSQASTEETNEIIEQINFMREALVKEVEPYSVTADETYSLFAVANIDFFVDSTNSADAFKTLYGTEGFDINKTFAEAESAVEKIETYNLTATEPYDYGHFFIESETDIISIKGLVDTVHDLRSSDQNLVNESIAELKGYTQYSSEVTVNYQKYDDNGNIIDEVQKLDKNALNKGGNQLADWITYYALLNNKSIINNDQLVSDMTALVDGTTYGFTPYQDIVLMTTEYCAENNIVMYDYTVGQYKLQQ